MKNFELINAARGKELIKDQIQNKSEIDRLNAYDDLVRDTIVPSNCKLYRLRALVDMPNIGVSAGDIGGYVSDEVYVYDDENIDHQPWVFPTSIVLGRVNIGPDVLLQETVRVYADRSGKITLKNIRANKDVVIDGSNLIIRHANIHNGVVIDGEDGYLFGRKDSYSTYTGPNTFIEIIDGCMEGPDICIGPNVEFKIKNDNDIRCKSTSERRRTSLINSPLLA